VIRLNNEVNQEIMATTTDKIIVHPDGKYYIAIAIKNGAFLAKERTYDLALTTAEAQYDCLVKEG
jgi:hypothetical protein